MWVVALIYIFRCGKFQQIHVISHNLDLNCDIEFGNILTHMRTGAKRGYGK